MSTAINLIHFQSTLTGQKLVDIKNPKRASFCKVEPEVSFFYASFQFCSVQRPNEKAKG